MPSIGQPVSPQPKAVGAYIFAGGFTLGVRRHFNVLCHLEENDYGVATAKHNMPRLPIYVGPDTWPTDQLAVSDVRFIYGNPPCAAWSVAGYTKTRGTDKWRTDPRVQCTVKHFQLLKEVEPDIWAWESVTQAFSKGEEFVHNLTREAAELGYSTTYILHDSQWLGLPQVRKRFFMVCHKIDFKPIIPSFESPPTPLDILKASRKGGQVCGGKSMTPIKQFDAKLLAKVKPGERLVAFWRRCLAHPDPEQWERNAQGGIKGRPSYGHCRLPLDRPGGAVVGYGIVHPTEHRWLSTEEMQVLSGFPSTYHFTPKGPSARASEIARGVCPPVGEWLAKAAKDAIKKSNPTRSTTVTLVDVRTPDYVVKDLTSEVL
jgi:site-specific DNA-cytosine methylase